MVGRIAADGQITLFNVRGNLNASDGITAGPDGHIWFTAWSECEGGGLTCSEWVPPPSAVGRISPGLLAIEVASERVPVRHGRAQFKLGCAGGKQKSICRGILRLKLESQAVVVYRAPYRVPSGEFRNLSLRLNPKALKLISRNYPLYAGLRATATVLGGRGASREVELLLGPRS